MGPWLEMLLYAVAIENRPNIGLGERFACIASFRVTATAPGLNSTIFG
jgi:hypothetical protein